jgi:chromosome segregation ATPase
VTDEARLFEDHWIRQQQRVADLSAERTRLEGRVNELVGELKTVRGENGALVQERDEAVRERDEARGEVPLLRTEIVELKGRLARYGNTTTVLVQAVEQLGPLASAIPKEES